MKKLYSLILIVLAWNYIHAQTTVTYTLDPNSEDATIDNYGPSNNYPNEIELASRAWTISSTPVTWRSLFKFNWCIPPNATVTSATLGLFYASVNNFGNGLHSSLTSSDESVVQRVTSPWTENTVTWNNQPSSTTTDEVIIPQSITGTDDYPNLDVTAMVQQMVSSSQNYGFLLMLTNETAYAQMFFASGDNPVAGKRPSLTVTYTVPATDCITITLDSNGEDATVDDYGPSNNYPNEIEMASRAWTISSVPVTWRSFFKFDLPCGLTNIVVQSAHLSLYYPPVNGFGNDVQSSLSSSNESVVQQVTSSWSENTVTWNNQPSSTTTGEVILPQSTSPTQDYTNLDVTAMAQQMFNTPGMNNGFLVKLTNEAAYAQMFFASGDNPDASKHPTLQICYSTLSSVNTINMENGLSIYPNPTADELTVNGFSNDGKRTINIYNTLGETIYTWQDTGDKNQVKVNVKNIPAGVYVVKVNGEKINWSGKFVKK